MREGSKLSAPDIERRVMNPKRLTLMVLATVPLLVLLSLGCSAQKTDDTQMADQAPPPSSEPEMAGSTAPEPPPPPPVESRTTTPTRPQRTHTSTIPEERPPALPRRRPPWCSRSRRGRPWR